nr:hypothetical protein [Tanacetum cinerariifolium]
MGLPRTFKKNDAIWVVVDRLTKSAHFLPVGKDLSARDCSVTWYPFELLYGQKCRAHICWNEVGERVIEGLELVEVTKENVAIAKEKLKEARSRQKSYADHHQRALEFKPGDRVFLKVSPCRGVQRFGLKWKLSLRFIGSFKILDPVGYNYHPYHVVQHPFDKIWEDLSFSEEPKAILDRQERVMRKKTIPLVKVLWKNHLEREATWENEEMMRTDYPHFFSLFGPWTYFIKPASLEFLGPDPNLNLEILRLTRMDGEEIRKCYMIYLDVFTSYYETARALGIPTYVKEGPQGLDSCQ